MKVNTTLKSLNLGCNEDEWKMKQINIVGWTTDNEIGTEGAKAVSEMLEANTTLSSLNLSSNKDEGEKVKGRDNKDVWVTDNNVGDEGAKSISQALKANTTLTSLNLFSEEEKENLKWKEKRKWMIIERQWIGLEF